LQPAAKCASGSLSCFVLSTVLFVQNIREFRGVKNLSAELAFDKLYVFLTGHDTYLRMFAGGRHRGI
jgi:hypothetical protein